MNTPLLFQLFLYPIFVSDCNAEFKCLRCWAPGDHEETSLHFNTLLHALAVCSGRLDTSYSVWRQSPVAHGIGGWILRSWGQAQYHLVTSLCDCSKLSRNHPLKGANRWRTINRKNTILILTTVSDSVVFIFYVIWIYNCEICLTVLHTETLWRVYEGKFLMGIQCFVKLVLPSCEKDVHFCIL